MSLVNINTLRQQTRHMEGVFSSDGQFQMVQN